MKGATSGGRARPSTPGATPSRRSSFHVSTDQSHAQCAGSLRRIVFKDLDDIIPNSNLNSPSSLHFCSSSHAAQERRLSLPHRPMGTMACRDRVLGRAPTPHASNGSTALSSISADLVRRTQGDARDSGHPSGMQHRQQRRFSSPAAFSSIRTACTSASSSSSSCSSSLYNNNSRGSAAMALRNSVLHSAASKLSLQKKLASGSECSPHIRRCSIDQCVNVAPLSTSFVTSPSTDALYSSHDNLLESRLHRMTLRSDSKAARKAAARQEFLLDDEYEEGFDEDEDAVDYEEDSFNVDGDVLHGGMHRQTETNLIVMPPRGYSCRVGLYNEGNTCYLNSCIQCLVHTMPLAEALLNGGADFSENREEIQQSGSKRFSKRASSSGHGSGSLSYSKRLNEANCVAREFKNLLTCMWSSSSAPYSVASASAFLRSLQSWDSQFSGFQQQDAQEAMRAILDGLHESLNRVKNRRYVDISRECDSRLEDELAAITWSYHKSLNDSLIQDIFCGQLESTIECSVCKRTSYCFDPFLDLSLPLPEHGGSLLGTRASNKWRVSILDCLASFVASETLNGRDRYKCANCKIPQLSTKTLSIYRVPAILVLHLKRFYGSGPFIRKDDTPVSYPLRGLDLTEFLRTTTQTLYPHGAVYDLYAVCHHSGSIGCGHYTAHCKDADGLWYSFNDSSVSTSNESCVVSSTAYILFYQLRHR